MPRSTARFTLSVALLLLVFAATEIAAQALPDGSTGGDPVDRENPLAVWLDAIQPAEPHRALADRAGTWAVVYRSWYKPGDTPVEVFGVAERSMILDNRVLEEKLSVQMPGREYTGVSHIGYDKVVESYWWQRLDNMSTWVTRSESAVLGEEGELTFSVPVADHTGGETSVARVVVRTEADSEVHEWHQTDASTGESFKSIEFVYTRTAGEESSADAEAAGESAEDVAAAEPGR